MTLVRTTLTRAGAAFLLAVSLVVGVAAVALAAFSPVDDNGAIHACYSQKNGALRVVAPRKACATGESPLTWNQVGPAGPAGPEGAVGATGPEGPAGPAGGLGCDDERRIADAVPDFALSPECAGPTGDPSGGSGTPDIALVDLNLPAQVIRGQSGEATVTLSAPVVTDTIVTLTSSPSSVLSTPGAVTVPAGFATATFQVTGLELGDAVVSASLGASDVAGYVSVVSKY